MVHCSRRLGAASIGALLVLLAYSYQPSLAQSPASTTVALIGARVIDGTGQPPLDQATILIVNGRIESVGTGAAVKIPSGATKVNLAGKTVMPGHDQRPWALGATATRNCRFATSWSSRCGCTRNTA